MRMADPIELVGGRWVTKPGGLRVWVPDEPYRDRTQADDAARMLLAILSAIAAGPTTCECGCLLISKHEPCPACRASARQEVA